MKLTMVLSETMEYYKMRIENSNQNSKDQKEDLEKAIKNNPKEEQHYIDLMMLFSKNNQEEKAFEVAKKLAEEIPSSEWAQVSLFKFYLQENLGEQAVVSMFKVFQNAKIDNKIKHRMLNEFLIFVNTTPAFENDLNLAVDYFNDDATVNVPKEVAKFFYNKKKYDITNFYLEKALSKQPNDFETILLLLENYIHLKDYEALANRAKIFIDFFPTQAKLYYYAGFSNNILKKHKEAIQYLEMGIEFVIDDLDLESQFYLQLSEAYKNNNNIKKSEENAKKAENLLKSKKK
jgi:tetratricopeptide (TPR) repeat protein